MDEFLGQKWVWQMPKDQCFTCYLPGASEEVTFLETERRMVAASGGGKKETGSCYLGGWSSRFAK